MNLEEIGSKADRLIMDVALRGGADCWGPVNVHWRAVGQYLTTYIEEMDVKVSRCRVFCIDGKAYYERKLVMHPQYSSDDYRCVYDSKDDAKGRTVLHAEGEEWLEYLREQI